MAAEEVGEVELTEFLLARIAEDEAAAQSLLEEIATLSSEPRGPWRNDGGRLYLTQAISLGIQPDIAEHIARHDPARVLAECEAKRRIVSLFAETLGDQLAAATGVWDEAAWKGAQALGYLAAVYSDHPDYDEAWRADG